MSARALPRRAAPVPVAGADPRPAPRARLVCFPHAGGGPGSFREWRAVMPRHIELVAAGIPARGEDRTTGTLADRLPGLLAGLHLALQDPVALYGHSLGALVAFEVARELRRRARPLPICLFVSGRRAPHRPLRHRPLSALPDRALAGHVRRETATTQPFLTRPLQRSRFLARLRAQLVLSDRYEYRPEPPLDCPIVALLGRRDHDVVVGDWEAWREQASSEFQAVRVPGAHIRTPAEQAAVAATVARLLDERLHRAFARLPTETS